MKIKRYLKKLSIILLIISLLTGISISTNLIDVGSLFPGLLGLIIIFVGIFAIAIIWLFYFLIRSITKKRKSR